MNNQYPNKYVQVLLGLLILWVGLIVAYLLYLSIFDSTNNQSESAQRLSESQACLKPIESALELTSIKYEHRNRSLKKGVNCLASLPSFPEENINYHKIISISEEIIAQKNGNPELSRQLKENIATLHNDLEAKTPKGFIKKVAPIVIFFGSIALCLSILIRLSLD